MSIGFIYYCLRHNIISICRIYFLQWEFMIHFQQQKYTIKYAKANALLQFSCSEQSEIRIKRRWTLTSSYQYYFNISQSKPFLIHRNSFTISSYFASHHHCIQILYRIATNHKFIFFQLIKTSNTILLNILFSNCFSITILFQYLTTTSVFIMLIGKFEFQSIKFNIIIKLIILIISTRIYESTIGYELNGNSTQLQKFLWRRSSKDLSTIWSRSSIIILHSLN